MSNSSASAVRLLMPNQSKILKHFRDKADVFNALAKKQDKKTFTQKSKRAKLHAGYMAKVTAETEKFFGVLVTICRKNMERLIRDKPHMREQILRDGYFDIEVNRPNLFKTWRVPPEKRLIYEVLETDCMCVTSHLLTLAQSDLGVILHKRNTSATLRKGKVVEMPNGRGNFVLRINLEYLLGQSLAPVAASDAENIPTETPLFLRQPQESFMKTILNIQIVKKEEDKENGVASPQLDNFFEVKKVTADRNMLEDEKSSETTGRGGISQFSDPKTTQTGTGAREDYAVQMAENRRFGREISQYATLLANQAVETYYANAKRILRPDGQGVRKVNTDETRILRTGFAAWLQFALSDPRWQQQTDLPPLSIYDAYKVISLVNEQQNLLYRRKKELKMMLPYSYIALNTTEDGELVVKPYTFSKMYDMYAVQIFTQYRDQLKRKNEKLNIEAVRCNARKLAFRLVDTVLTGKIPQTDATKLQGICFNEKLMLTKQLQMLHTEGVLDIRQHEAAIHAMYDSIVCQVFVFNADLGKKMKDRRQVTGVTGDKQQATSDSVENTAPHCVENTEGAVNNSNPTPPKRDRLAELLRDLRATYGVLINPPRDISFAEFNSHYEKFKTLGKVALMTKLVETHPQLVERVNAAINSPATGLWYTHQRKWGNDQQTEN
jgi:hypothetical protein